MAHIQLSNQRLTREPADFQTSAIPLATMCQVGIADHLCPLKSRSKQFLMGELQPCIHAITTGIRCDFPREYNDKSIRNNCPGCRTVTIAQAALEELARREGSNNA